MGLLKGCIVLHSVSALPVRACEMRQVVTSYLYSVTRGEMSSSGMDEAKSLFDKETQADTWCFSNVNGWS